MLGRHLHPGSTENHARGEGPQSREKVPPSEGGKSGRGALDPCGILMEHLGLGVLYVDSSHRVRLANAAASRLGGISGRISPGDTCSSVLACRSESCPACPECPGSRALATGQPTCHEIERTFPEGTRTLFLRAYPLPDSAFAIVLEDVTDRRRGEKDLREAFVEAGRARDWIDSILKSVPDGLIVSDPEGRVLLMNQAAEKLLGVRQAPLFQSSLEDCIFDRRLLKRLREALDSGGDGERFEYELASGPAGVRVVTVDVSRVRSRIEGGLGTVFLLRDMTRERELDRMKNEFVSTAAHELRTPLTSIMGFSELLLTRRDLDPEQQNDFLTYIHQKAENLSRIISDLLDISRIEAGRGLELDREPCDIRNLVQETVEPYRQRSGPHTLEVVLPEEKVVLSLDRGKIIQVMENLLSNAFKYSPRGGRIRVAASLVRGGYLLSVEDQGIGMTREQVGRAFEKFYRADSSNAAVEGTGLGLSITRYIVEAHGGRIWLESRRGKGTTASFSLPLPWGKTE